MKTMSRLRLAGWLEGTSLLALVFVGVPLKYAFAMPELTRILGPVHGCLFLFFVFSAVQTAIEQNWKFSETTWKVLVSCLVPFGTFYIDRAILRPMQNRSHGKNI